MKLYFFSILFILFPLILKAQNVVGTIVDANSEPIPFAKVWVKSTSFGTVSNGKAEYNLEFKDTGTRSEERRVGKESRSRWSPNH